MTIPAPNPEPTLRERLQAGPGSRELSDAFLLEIGWWQKERNGQLFWQSPDPNWRPMDGVPDPAQSTDDALAMVPEGCGIKTYMNDGIASAWFADDEFAVAGDRAPWAYGDNPLPRAILLAILAAKEAEK